MSKEGRWRKYLSIYETIIFHSGLFRSKFHEEAEFY
jgi:hypothetical protein